MGCTHFQGCDVHTLGSSCTMHKHQLRGQQRLRSSPGLLNLETQWEFYQPLYGGPPFCNQLISLDHAFLAWYTDWWHGMRSEDQTVEHPEHQPMKTANRCGTHISNQAVSSAFHMDNTIWSSQQPSEKEKSSFFCPGKVQPQKYQTDKRIISQASVSIFGFGVLRTGR